MIPDVGRARQAMKSPLRRLMAGIVLSGVIAAAVVFLILPGSASSTSASCTSPKFDYFTPKRGEPGDTIEIHGSKLGYVEDISFKGKGGYAGTDNETAWELVDGVIYLTIPNPAVGDDEGNAIVDGPIFLFVGDDEGSCAPVSSVKPFDIFPY
jgi:signal peptidase I